MVFDTDIFIWVQRGNPRAARAVDSVSERCLSVYSFMEFLQGARDRKELLLNQSFLRDLDFQTLPLTENIGHRASIYVEQYALSHKMRAGDAIIAATAAEHGMTLVTSNAKHYRQIPELKLKVVKP